MLFFSFLATCAHYLFLQQQIVPAQSCLLPCFPFFSYLSVVNILTIGYLLCQKSLFFPFMLLVACHR